MTSKRAGMVLYALLAYLAIILLTTLMLVSNPALAQLGVAATDYNVLKGTDCNDSNAGAHPLLNKPENTRCRASDIVGAWGADKLIGRNGWDWLVGKDGADFLIGNRGMDAYYPGNGDDRVIDTVARRSQPVKDDENHDHAWLGEGNDYGDISDGYDEPNHVEEIHGGFRDKPNGTDTCIVDNDPGDTVQGCEHITVVKDDGTKISFKLQPGDHLSRAVPKGVRVTVKPAEV